MKSPRTIALRFGPRRSKRYAVELLVVVLLPQSREVDGDGVAREGALHLQLGSRGVARGRSVRMLASSPAAAALTAHHHPAQGSQPATDTETEAVHVKKHENIAMKQVDKLQCKSAI